MSAVRHAKDPPACLQAALAYLARGWSAIALCPPNHSGVGDKHRAQCDNPGKVPVVPWEEYQRRLPTEAELRAWWRRNPLCNVGVILGQVSGIVGLDVDGPDADAMLLEISKGQGLHTLEFKTPGGGKRLLYSLPKGVIIPKKHIRRGESHVLVLGEGSLTVMPPSIHANGGVYA